MTVVALDAKWLRDVENIAEADLPCNISTVAHAIRVAVAYRAEATFWHALFEEFSASAVAAGDGLGSPGTPSSPAASGAAGSPPRPGSSTTADATRPAAPTP